MSNTNQKMLNLMILISECMFNFMILIYLHSPVKNQASGSAADATDIPQLDSLKSRGIPKSACHMLQAQDLRV